MSTSSHYGSRMVCAECALNIDYNAKKQAIMGKFLTLPILLYFLLIIPVGISLGVSTKSWLQGLSVAIFGFIPVFVICRFGKTKAEEDASVWYVANKSRYLGVSASTSSDNELQSIIRHDEIPVESWKCNSCGYSYNPMSVVKCEKCNSPRYAYESLSVDEKNIVKEFAEKVLPLQTFAEIIKLQDIYFNTTPSLDFMRFILPDARKYKDIDSYKNNVRRICGNNNQQSNANTYSPETSRKESVNALQAVLNTISDRIQQEITILETKQTYINELLKNTSFTTINDCDKAISEVEKCEKEIEKSKKTVVKFCNEYTKQLNEVSFDIDAVAYAKNFIEKAKLGFTDYTNQFVNQLKSNENQILQAKINIISG